MVIRDVMLNFKNAILAYQSPRPIKTNKMNEKMNALENILKLEYNEETEGINLLNFFSFCYKT